MISVGCTRELLLGPWLSSAHAVAEEGGRAGPAGGQGEGGDGTTAVLSAFGQCAALWFVYK